MDDLIIVGAGWAGLTAAAYALERGAKVRLIAQGVGSPIVSPGWVSAWDDPPKEPTGRPGRIEIALPQLIQNVQDHPYALAGIDSLRDALTSFVDLTKKIDLPYSYWGSLSSEHQDVVVRAFGQMYRPPICIPEGYQFGTKFPFSSTLFIGFEGWRDYYPAMIDGETAMISLPLDRPWDATPTDLAREFDKPDFRVEVAQRVKAVMNSACSVGFPAVLGLENPQEVRADLKRLLDDTPVFEIPTLPPSVPGTRLVNKLRRYFLDNGVRVQIGHPVTRGLIENGRVVGVEVAAAGKPQRFYGKNVILATGGLYGGGLFSDDRGRIWEPIFNLPVKHNQDRTTWFNDNLLDLRGHPIHYVGVRANNRMQPLDEHGDPVAEGLYVAGHILAHPEGGPPPFETSEGVALATAYRAVQCALGIEE